MVIISDNIDIILYIYIYIMHHYLMLRLTIIDPRNALVPRPPSLGVAQKDMKHQQCVPIDMPFIIHVLLR